MIRDHHSADSLSEQDFPYTMDVFIFRLRLIKMTSLRSVGIVRELGMSWREREEI